MRPYSLGRAPSNNRTSTTEMNQQALTNLDQDVTKARLDKYYKSQQEIKLWVFETLDMPESEINAYNARNQHLVEILKNGLVLCQLGNLLAIPNNPCRKLKNLRMPFVQMENILFFLNTCEIIGVANDEMFQTVDLFDERDPYQVIVTLMAFSRLAHSLNNKIPLIGPKATKVKPQVPYKPIKLRL